MRRRALRLARWGEVGGGEPDIENKIVGELGLNRLGYLRQRFRCGSEIHLRLRSYPFDVILLPDEQSTC